MFGRAGIYLIALFLALLLMSCTKIEESPTSMGGDIAVVKVPYADSIPLNWGHLVSVSRVADYNVYQLFFEDEDGAVRIVSYNIETNRFSPNVRIISRR